MSAFKIRKTIMEFYKQYKPENQPVISFEIFPPKTEEGFENLTETLDELKELSPDYITVTYGAMGTTRGKTIQIASLIQDKMNINTACHLTCVNATKDEITDILREIKRSGIRNIVALRGDPPAGEKEFTPPENGYSHANELVEHIRNFERENKDNDQRFGIAVAGYPEKHLEAPDFETDIQNLKRKVDAGADIIITQLFFDNSYFFDFMEKVERAGIDVPVIPGLMPILSTKQIVKITSMCGSKIPAQLSNKLDKAGDDNMLARQIGIEQCTRQAAELLEYGVPGIHFYVLNRASHVKRIFDSLDIIPDN